MATYGGVTAPTQYAARQIYYKQQYGVTYNEYRRLARNAAAQDIKGEDVRTALVQIKSQGGNGKQVVETLTGQVERARAQYRAGLPVDFPIDEYEYLDLPDEWFWYHS